MRGPVKVTETPVQNQYAGLKPIEKSASLGLKVLVPDAATVVVLVKVSVTELLYVDVELVELPMTLVEVEVIETALVAMLVLEVDDVLLV